MTGAGDTVMEEPTASQPSEEEKPSSLQLTGQDESEGKDVPKNHLYRIICAFWILGMCNNYIYVIMLSAAHDVIVKVEAKDGELDNTTQVGDASRNCTDLSTGAILLADILPTLFVKLLFPFLPFLVHVRIAFAVLTGVLALILVGVSETITLALVGVAFASFNSGLGELTLLAYSTRFVLHAIAAWSSGTGGAGLIGSFAYAGMTEGGLSPETTLFISIVIPLLMAASFWIILKHPPKEKVQEIQTRARCPTPKEMYVSLLEKLKLVPMFLPYMIPVGLVYYFEYLINSGLFDKLIFLNTSMSPKSQFRWYNATYQIGVFISRSSVTWFHFKKVWVMAVLQGINVIIFFCEALYGFIPNVWIMFALILWEGLLGGAAYVNTFYNMSYEIKKEHRLFALSIASVADTFGIVSAGFTSFPIHKYICRAPYDPVFRWP